MDIFAPLEILVDSFSEIEHTSFVHVLGFDPARWGEVRFTVDSDAHSVRVSCSGPQKLPVRLGMAAARIPRGSHYHVDWETRFSPLHTRFVHYWKHPETGAVHPEQALAIAFFNPRTATSSSAVVTTWTSTRPWGRLGLNKVLHPLHAGLIRYEFERDKEMLDRMPQGVSDLRRAGLGPGDKAVTATRARLERIYRGSPA